MVVRPLADRVLIRVEKSEAKTPGGIIIPDNAKEKTQQGVVAEVGPGTEEMPITVKKGDKVMYDKYAGTPISIEGEEFLIVKVADVIAVLE